MDILKHWRFDPISAIAGIALAVIFTRAHIAKHERALTIAKANMNALCEKLAFEIQKTIAERLCCQHQKLCAVGNRVAGLTSTQLAVYKDIVLEAGADWPAGVKKLVAQWEADARKNGQQHLIEDDEASLTATLGALT